MRVLTVRPMASGWGFDPGGLAEEAVYRSGAAAEAAEAAGRRLAQRLAAAGDAATLVIKLRDGSVGGRLLFLPGGEAAPALAA